MRFPVVHSLIGPLLIPIWRARSAAVQSRRPSCRLIHEAISGSVKVDTFVEIEAGKLRGEDYLTPLRDRSNVYQWSE